MRRAGGSGLLRGEDEGRSAPLGPADWLSLAAAPSFGLMAVLTAGHGPMDLFCVTPGHGAFLGGMAPMYVMMAVFHSAPWVRLIGRR